MDLHCFPDMIVFPLTMYLIRSSRIQWKLKSLSRKLRIAAGLLEIMYLELSEYVYLSSSGVGHPSGALVARFSPCVDQLAYFTRTVLAYLGYFSITHLHACRLCN